MPPVVAAAAISGGAALAGGVVSSRQQSGANRRAIQAQERAAQRAETFEREQDRLNRSDQERRDAEDRRRYETEQANIARRQAQEDALLQDQLARQQYDDDAQYQRRLNIARLTGQPAPPRPPRRTAASALQTSPVAPQGAAMPTGAIASAPSRANAMVQDAAGFDPFQAPTQRMPISRLSGRSY